jgi:hypothetical protein
MSNEIVASTSIDAVMNSTVNMDEKSIALELRRLMVQLRYTGIPDTVCDETLSRIINLVKPDPWTMCNQGGGSVMGFIHSEHHRWAKNGYSILIEGGSERERCRVMNYCLYRAILARFSSFGFIAKIYDWPTLLPIVGDYKHPSKLTYIEGMRSAKVLAITELDTMVSMSTGGVDNILTSILRGRKFANKPTIITLKRAYEYTKKSGVGQIYELVDTKHDTEVDQVVRIKIREEDNEAE